MENTRTGKYLPSSTSLFFPSSLFPFPIFYFLCEIIFPTLQLPKQTMATQKAAQWAASLTYSSLPPDALQAAIRSFYNWVGCTVGGSNHPAASIARNSLSRFFGSPTSTLLGTNGLQADAQHAALINGIASHVHDYDDTHLETIIHPTGPIAAALLSFAQSLDRPVSGQDFLAALAAGIELECKAGLAVWPSHYDVGWYVC